MKAAQAAAEQKVSATKAEADKQVRKTTEEAERAIKAEQERTRETKEELDEVRRKLALTKFRTDLRA